MMQATPVINIAIIYIIIYYYYMSQGPGCASVTDLQTGQSCGWIFKKQVIMTFHVVIEYGFYPL